MMRIRNERGVTLVEMLAGLVLVAVILAVGTMLMAQIGALTRNASQQALDSNSSMMAVQIVREELSQASEVFVVSANELRFRQNFEYYAFYVTPGATRTLTMYRFNDLGSSADLHDQQIAAAQALFISGTTAFENNPGLYTSPRVLSPLVANVGFKQPSGSAYVNSPAATRIESGNFRMDIQFIHRRNRAGTPATVHDTNNKREQFEIIVNLLSD